MQAGLGTDFTMSSSILVEERGSVFCVGAGVVMPTFMGLPAPRVGWMDTGTGTGTLHLTILADGQVWAPEM